MKKQLLFLFAALLSLNFIACNDNDDPIPTPAVDAAYLVEGNYDVYTMWSTSTGHRDIIQSEDFNVTKVGNGLIKIETHNIKLDTAKNKNISIGIIKLDSIPLQVLGENNYAFESKGTMTFDEHENAEVIIKGSINNGIISSTIALNHKDISISLIFDGEQIANNKVCSINFNVQCNHTVGSN